VGRHRTGPSIAAGLAGVAILTGCSFDRPLPTYQGVIDQGVGFEGVLRLDGECVWVDSIDSFDPVKLHVVWPTGYRWRGPPLEIVDASGAIVARDGDLVSFGIVDRQHGTVAGCPAGDTARATEIGTVNGENRFRAPPRTSAPVIR
jgi:hypothetical protein